MVLAVGGGEDHFLNEGLGLPFVIVAERHGEVIEEGLVSRFQAGGAEVTEGLDNSVPKEFKENTVHEHAGEEAIFGVGHPLGHFEAVAGRGVVGVEDFGNSGLQDLAFVHGIAADPEPGLADAFRWTIEHDGEFGAFDPGDVLVQFTDAFGERDMLGIGK